MITWAKEGGEWVVCGPAADVTTGAVVTVCRKSGQTSRVRVGKVLRTFRMGGDTIALARKDEEFKGDRPRTAPKAPLKAAPAPKAPLKVAPATPATCCLCGDKLWGPSADPACCGACAPLD